MPVSQKKKSALILTTLLVLSTLAFSASTNAEETSARVTNNEEISVSINDVYYDRGGDITLTMVSINLDPGTEYAIDWVLCNWNGYSCNNQYTASTLSASGSLDLGSGNMIAVSTVTFTDIGPTTEYYDANGDYHYQEGIENNSMVFRAELNVQGVPLHANISEPFVLGGEMEEWSSLDTVSNILKTMDVEFQGQINMDHQNERVLDYTLTCELFESGGTTPVDSVSTTVNTSSDYYDFSSGTFYDESTSTLHRLTPTATSGDHYVECSYVRDTDNGLVGTLTSNVFQVIDDTSNQDDATISVSVDMHPTESWGTVVIDAIDLDAGQEYTLNWIVENYLLTTPATMMQNDHIWVAGNDGTHSYSLEFHDLADTIDACITVVFTAGETELQTVSNVCWASASTADGDGDGVYDKNDLCPDTTAGFAVDADGCSDSDNDGFDTNLEIDCNTGPNDPLSFPTDFDGDQTCDYLDTDDDNDGYLDVDEVAAGTDPLDPNSKPANRLPTCAVYYSLEVDGAPTTFEGDAVIPALSGVSAQAAASTLVPTTITIPAGSYYITAHCIDLDGDDITVTVNDITIGPVAGEVSAGAIIEIGEDVEETVDVQITWTDGQDTLTALVTVELDGDSGWIPGFGASLAIMALIGAGIVISRRNE
jgi:PGF-CTERM protein